LAVVRIRMIVDRSTCCCSTAGDRYLLPDQLNQISSFCVGVWNRFARLPARSLPWSDRVIVGSFETGRRSRQKA